MEQISKLDAARRQLLAAIHLHWYFTEPLAVYSLASNTWEICDTLLKHMDKVRLLREISEVHGSTDREIRKLINEPRNFLKHADRDPDGTMQDLDAADCDAIVETACIDYMMASGRSPSILGLYLAWYSAINPEKTGGFFRGGADTFFPGLAERPRAEQIRAARKLAIQPLPSPVLNDPKNELTDNWRWASLREKGFDFPAR